MNAEVENKPKKAVQKRRQEMAAPYALHEADSTVALKQAPALQKNELSGEAITAVPENTTIPAVHGSGSVYAAGSELKHKELQESLDKTGDLSHPETQKKEQDYKSSLSIPELREYHDIKSGAVVANKDANGSVEKVAAGAVEVPKQEAKPAAAIKAVGENAVAKDEATDKAQKEEAEVKVPQSASETPAFMELQSQINTTAKAQQKHEPATKSSKDAQAAAPSPANERLGMAQAGQVNKMDAQEPGKFSASDFEAQLRKKIAGMKLPENEEQADEFDKNNNIKEVNQSAMADVKQEKNAASEAIASTTAAKPKTETQPVRNVAKMPVQNPGKAPAAINVSKAMPAKRDARSVEKPLEAETGSLDEQMAANGVTDSMLANSNEPSFKGALDEKNKAKEQSKSATTQFRANETKELSATRTGAQAQASKQIAGMHAARVGGLNKVHGNQTQTASKDTEKRKEISDRINGIYNTTKAQVEGILKGLDTTVASKFEAGSKIAKAAFEKHVKDKMLAYKLKRYGKAFVSYGALATAGLWIYDQFAGLPKEVNNFFVSGKKLYIDTMNIYIKQIAEYVTTQLNNAKSRIASGKKAVQDYVSSLSPSLRKLGQAAVNEIQAKFNALEQDVNNKKDALIDVLAKKYSENVAAIDARIKELKEQNKGLVSKAFDAISGIIAIIIDIKNTLTNLLAKIIQVVGVIIADPIGFFGLLVEGVTQGFTNFVTNIWTHLKTGFFSWLTGAMQGVSITMPEDVFSIKGIFSLSMQLLGISWDAIRSIGATVVGEPIMKVLETGVEVVQVIRKDGVAGLWEYLKDKFQDLKQTVMDTIMDLIQTQVIQAGIKWILGLLSPVGAFVKAAMAIIDAVKFFIQRAAQIIELVNAFVDSVAAIASGKVGAVAKAIEGALAKAVPVLIGFLASLLGISGLADKVLGVIKKIRQRIVDGITKFWVYIKEKGKALLGKVKNAFGGKKDKKSADDKRTTAEKQKDLDDGVKEGEQLLNDKSLDKKAIKKRLDDLKDKYDLQELKIVTDKVDKDTETVHIHGEVNPKKDSRKREIKIDDAPKRGDHIFNLGLGKSFRSLVSVTHSQPSLSAGFTKAANTVDAQEFHMTVRKEEKRINAGDFNSQKFGATKALLEERMIEFIEAVNHHKPTNPSAIASLIKELIDNSIDYDAINYLDVKDKQQAQAGKNKLAEIEQYLAKEIRGIESKNEKDSGDTDVETAKLELKIAISETQEILDKREISRTMRINELEALKENMNEIGRLKGMSSDETKYYLDRARGELKEIEHFQINDKDDKELILLEINKIITDVKKVKRLILQQKIN